MWSGVVLSRHGGRNANFDLGLSTLRRVSVATVNSFFELTVGLSLKKTHGQPETLTVATNIYPVVWDVCGYAESHIPQSGICASRVMGYPRSAPLGDS